jgi:hypothetical protein
MLLQSRTDLKTCCGCEKKKPFTQFYKRKGRETPFYYSYKCKECARKDVRETYQKNIGKRHQYEKQRAKKPARREQAKQIMLRYGLNNPGKQRARQRLGNAIRDGRIRRKPCEVCGDAKAQGHHPDYRKPLDVRWLCFIHHRQTHGQMQNQLPNGQR